MNNFTQILRERLTSKSARSDVLRPLVWFTGLLMSGLIAAAQIKAPEWALIAIFVLLALSASMYLFAFAFCLLIDRDALRSEKYLTDKLAIENGVYGDDIRGIVIDATAEERASPAALPAPKKKAEKSK